MSSNWDKRLYFYLFGSYRVVSFREERENRLMYTYTDTLGIRFILLLAKGGEREKVLNYSRETIREIFVSENHTTHGEAKKRKGNETVEQHLIPTI